MRNFQKSYALAARKMLGIRVLKLRQSYDELRKTLDLKKYLENRDPAQKYSSGCFTVFYYTRALSIVWMKFLFHDIGIV